MTVNTYIIFGICVYISILLYMFDEIRYRIYEKRRENNKKKGVDKSPALVWMTSTDSNTKDFPYEHEIGFKLIYKKLINAKVSSERFPGKVGILIFFLVVVPWFLIFFAYAMDGTLTLPGSATGLLEDKLTIPLLLGVAVILYLYCYVIEYVPEAYRSIVKNSNNEKTNDPSKKNQTNAKEVLRKEAEYIMYYPRRNKRLIINLSFIALMAIIMVGGWLLDSNFTNPEDVLWSAADYFWGNLMFISYMTLVMCYFLRVLLSYIFRLTFSMQNLGRDLSGKGILRINPLHPDRAGGLGKFGKLAWRLDIMIIPAIIFLIVYFLFADKIDANMFAIIILLTLALIPFLFFVPLRGLNKAMKDAKRCEMDSLSEKFHICYQQMRAWVDNKGISDEDGRCVEAEMQRIILLYERAEKMPVWPFDRNTIGKVVTTVIIPLLIVGIQMIIQNLID